MLFALETVGEHIIAELLTQNRQDVVEKLWTKQAAKIECVEIDINACPLDPLKMKEFLEESSENRQWIYFKGQESSK